jgi:hypothetical protein
VIIGPLREGSATTVGLLPVTQLGRQADLWIYVSHVPVGETDVPANVAGVSVEALPGGVRISWTHNDSNRYVATEVRIGSSWGATTAADRLFMGSADSHFWQWPSAGTYTLLFVHWDSSGSRSATPTSYTLVVNADATIGTVAMWNTSAPANAIWYTSAPSPATWGGAVSIQISRNELTADAVSGVESMMFFDAVGVMHSNVS